MNPGIGENYFFIIWKFDKFFHGRNWFFSVFTRKSSISWYPQKKTCFGSADTALECSFSSNFFWIFKKEGSNAQFYPVLIIFSFFHHRMRLQTIESCTRFPFQRSSVHWEPTKLPILPKVLEVFVHTKQEYLNSNLDCLKKACLEQDFRFSMFTAGHEYEIILSHFFICIPSSAKSYSGKTNFWNEKLYSQVYFAESRTFPRFFHNLNKREQKK